jgi:hypothetical protein
LRQPQGALQIHHASLCKKIKRQPLDFEWVAQVSILRPGFLLRNRSYRNTHSMIIRAIFIFLGGPQAHRNSGRETRGEMWLRSDLLR